MHFSEGHPRDPHWSLSLLNSKWHTNPSTSLQIPHPFPGNVGVGSGGKYSSLLYLCKPVLWWWATVYQSPATVPQKPVPKGSLPVPLYAPCSAAYCLEPLERETFCPVGNSNATFAFICNWNKLSKCLFPTEGKNLRETWFLKVRITYDTAMDRSTKASGSDMALSIALDPGINKSLVAQDQEVYPHISSVTGSFTTAAF